MKKLPTSAELQQMTDEEVATLNRKVAKKLISFVVVYGGLKVVTYLALRRWARSVIEND